MSKDVNRWVVLGLCFLATYVTFTGFAGTAALIPLMLEDFHIGIGEAVLFMAIPLFLCGVYSIFTGRLGDHIGPRKAVVIGLLVMGVFGGLRGVSASPAMFLILVSVAAFGIGAVWASVPKLLGTYFPPKQYATSVAVGQVVPYDAGNFTGLAFAIPLGAALVALSSSLFGGIWQGSFMFVGLLSILVAIIWLIVIPERKGGEVSIPNERRIGFWALYRDVFRVRQLWVLTAAVFCYMGGIYAFVGLMPTVLTQFKGIDAATAGFVVAVECIVALLFEFIGGVVSDKVGLRKPFLIGLIAASIVVCLVATRLLVGITSAWVIMAVAGIGFGFPLPLIFAMPLEMEGIGVGRAATAEGTLICASMIGGGVAMGIGGVILDAGAFAGYFVFLAALFAVATILAMRLKETGWRVKTKE